MAEVMVQNVAYRATVYRTVIFTNNLEAVNFGGFEALHKMKGTKKGEINSVSSIINQILK
jgi:hypothetical protein